VTSSGRGEITKGISEYKWLERAHKIYQWFQVGERSQKISVNTSDRRKLTKRSVTSSGWGEMTKDISEYKWLEETTKDIMTSSGWEEMTKDISECKWLEETTKDIMTSFVWEEITKILGLLNSGGSGDLSMRSVNSSC
jgi:hypothetical protein